ncbi:MAG: SulP family inorganic anion transporter [Candidatus Woesearchaeota archaeon]
MNFKNINWSNVKSDVVAGLIVAIVALPLAIGFSIASGVSPVMGIYAAIVGGLIAAIFGGSEFQISGPTGAMVVVILAVLAEYGLQGLIISTFLAGIILLILWALRLGKAIEYIPHPVIVGFTAGIAVLIFFGQMNNFLGVNPVYPADTEFIGKTIISISQFFHSNMYAILLALVTIAILYFTPKFTKKIPGSIIAVILGLVVTFFIGSHLGLATVGDVGEIPSKIPMPQFFDIDLKLVLKLLPAALTIAALAAIESLLSAVVADGMTGSRHDPNKELRGQGFANIGSALFGGLPVTGAIARTATNVRNGGKTRLAGIVHAIILLIILVSLGPLFSGIPLAVIAGILMFVAINMVEWRIIFETFRMPLSDVVVMITTFLLTILVDLTVAIEVGIVLASLLFMKRMADLYKVEEHGVDPDETMHTKEVVQKFHHPDISIYTLNGPLFFGAAARLDQELSNTPGSHKPIKILRMKYVSVIDASGIASLKAIIRNHNKKGKIMLSTIQPQVYRLLNESGVLDMVGFENVRKRTSHAFKQALIYSHKMHGQPERITKKEMEQYDLASIDADDTHISKLHDKDPIEGMLDDTGISTIHRKTIDTGKRVGKLADDYNNQRIARARKNKREIVENSPIKSEKLERNLPKFK